MTLNADNVVVALTGAAYTGPKGTTLPTNATSEWDEEMTDLGYISEDGITETPNDENTEIKGWQNGDTVREMISGSKTTYSLTLIETTKIGLELYHRGNKVTGDLPNAKQEITGPKSDKRAFGFDVIDGDKLHRIVIPNGEVTERGAIQYQNGEAVGYEITVTAYPAEGGVHTIKYWNALEADPDPDPDPDPET